MPISLRTSPAPPQKKLLSSRSYAADTWHRAWQATDIQEGRNDAILTMCLTKHTPVSKEQKGSTDRARGQGCFYAPYSEQNGFDYICLKSFNVLFCFP